MNIDVKSEGGHLLTWDHGLVKMQGSVSIIQRAIRALESDIAALCDQLRLFPVQGWLNVLGSKTIAQLIQAAARSPPILLGTRRNGQGTYTEAASTTHLEVGATVDLRMKGKPSLQQIARGNPQLRKHIARAAQPTNARLEEDNSFTRYLGALRNLFYQHDFQYLIQTTLPL